MCFNSFTFILSVLLLSQVLFDLVFVDVELQMLHVLQSGTVLSMCSKCLSGEQVIRWFSSWRFKKRKLLHLFLLASLDYNHSCLWNCVLLVSADLLSDWTTHLKVSPVLQVSTWVESDRIHSVTCWMFSITAVHLFFWFSALPTTTTGGSERLLWGQTASCLKDRFTLYTESETNSFKPDEHEVCLCVMIPPVHTEH